ncbi:polysaccharide deacetylase family protein [Paenibacillus sp. GCM10012307]|uniref:Polysaccharide deacetylase family protein n=1 Tax=Paenibacillus roseus TaxID=2798579 RepID=A0A934J8Y1_9BACL|nr:polysaccharide deacetylase family protein [Paenibacillus roseus]MBJ6363994.1 polysaccharide deacetylase family protein [Paenibacillus roseus]
MQTTRKPWIVLLSFVLIASMILSACGKAEEQLEPDPSIKIVVNGKVWNDTGAAVNSEGRLMVPSEFLKKAVENGEEPPAEHVEGTVYFKNQVAVLMYHDVTEGETTKTALSVKDFEEQMELLKTNGFHVISMKEYSDFMLQQKAVPDNAVLITFDDGYESFYTLAYPILKKYGYPATNFVIVSFVDHRIGVPKMTWDQMREMKKEGMTFYNHTYNSHLYINVDKKGRTKPALTQPMYLDNEDRKETQEEYKKRITDDLVKAEERLKEELGNTDSIIAFPYGAFNQDVLELLKSLNIHISFTVRKGINSSKDVNGFRVNGADVKENPRIVINHLKNLTEASFEGSGKSGKTSKLVSLRQYCDKNNISLAWDPSTREARLTFAKKT